MSPAASLEAQRTRRTISFFIAAERAAMKNTRQLKLRLQKPTISNFRIRERFDETHSPQVYGFCFSASQRKAK
jgi:hypothetical protein